ncbi:zinc knuckle CX2CX4HX4C containing protein [Tanacetum coccineum]
MDSVMESGPWLIRGVPLILNIWTQNTVLKKDVIKHAPLWVKLHHVPIVAYSEIGLSLITTQLGKPITLDSYTSNMCLSSWGRNSYARALIEFSAGEELKDSIVIAIPLSNGKGHTLATIEIEYEWTPPRCNECKVFDHGDDACPKNPKKGVPNKEINVEKEDGFTVVHKKKSSKAKQGNKKQIEGVRLTKPGINLKYRKVDRDETAKKNDSMGNPKPTTGVVIDKHVGNSKAGPSISTNNSFSALLNDDENPNKSCTPINEDSDCEAFDEELVLEDRNGRRNTT